MINSYLNKFISKFYKQAVPLTQIRLFSVIDVVVSSLRIDRLLATGLGTGRNKIELSLLSGCVKLNGKTVLDKSVEVKKGDIIDRISQENSTEEKYVLARVQLQEIGEKTIKGNIRVRLMRSKYIVIEKLNYQSSLQIESRE
ncbi:mitochondrial transcription rescue factor 1-like [Hydra vulgaris]|uniref:Mitochondrial transcription rescue factor 1-like n=1 Tax=Hydra vulgaris TaxID=6087 RepID=A0ABM4BVR0_HYDVU